MPAVSLSQGHTHMTKWIRWSLMIVAAVWVGMLAIVSTQVTGFAPASSGNPRLGGATGTVTNVKQLPLEGIGVQLLAQKTAIRTTVYTDENGRFEFPVLEAGTYTLRIARPMEYQPYVKEPLQLSGSPALPTIVLERVSGTEFLPPTTEILGQLTGIEWVHNLEGTGEEKRAFSFTCGFGCHSYQQIFRNRYDESGWRNIVQRMMRGGGAPLINMGASTQSSRFIQEEGGPFREDTIVKWLARVRGPESKDPPIYPAPRARGRGTRVIVTEYQVPRELISLHDVHGDSKGNIWYTSHRAAYQGVLNPRTGEVTEYRIPEKAADTPDVLPGVHRVWVDKNDVVWFSEQWDHYLTGLDSKTGKIVQRVRVAAENAVYNSPGFGNFAMDDAGFVYTIRDRAVNKIDSKTGTTVATFPLKGTITGTYDNIVTPDGRFWSGGNSGGKAVGLLDMKTGEYLEVETPTSVASAARGGFDPEGNAWFGGRNGALLRLSPKTKRLTEFWPPFSDATFYEAMPDKNGEVWAGAMHAGAMLRFNPKTDAWTTYMMPEPFSHDRRTWIDNSSNPVTVWYVDNDGYLVRVQPLD